MAVVAGPGRENESWASSPAVRRTMMANRRTDTRPEKRLRSALHRQGFRFRKDHPVRAGGRLVRPDVVFTRARVAVFVDGCFWHLCPQHSNIPKTNRDFWHAKLTRNVERDRVVDEVLTRDGWHVVRVWEHVDTLDGARTVAEAVAAAIHRSGHELPSSSQSGASP